MPSARIGPGRVRTARPPGAGPASPTGPGRSGPRQPGGSAAARDERQPGPETDPLP